MVIASWTADALFPTLVKHHPLLLITLSSRSRNLALVTNQLDALSYYGVGGLRLLVSDPFFFLLGHWYGDAATTWLEKRSPTYGGYLRSAERWFGKAAYPLVFLAPNNFICLFAGASRMRVPVFLALNISGTIVRLYVIRRIGETFSDPLADFTDFVARYRWQILPITVGLVVWSIWSDRRKGQGELSALTHLDDDLLGDDDQVRGE